MLNVGHWRSFVPNLAYFGTRWGRRGREIIKIHLRSNTRWRKVPLLKVTLLKQQMRFVLTECDGGQVFDRWESKNRGVPLTFEWPVQQFCTTVQTVITLPILLLLNSHFKIHDQGWQCMKWVCVDRLWWWSEVDRMWFHVRGDLR